MGIIKKQFFAAIFGLFLLAGMVACAQTNLPPIHKINGKKYYLHIVEAGQTLYGISRTYEVTIDELLAENPVVKDDGLKVNQTLLVPVTKDNRKELESVSESTDRNYLEYTVKPQETLYSIARNYNTSLEALLEANPELGTNSLKSGQSIKIPYQDIEVRSEAVVASAKHDTLKGHVVQAGETLYALSVKYGVTQQQLLDANEGLPFGLKVGMMLRIPNTYVAPPVEETFPIDIDSDFDSLFKPRKPANYQHITIAMMLPLNAVDPANENPVSFQVASSNRIPLSFFRGFQFAVDSLVEMTDSLSVDVRLYDLPRDSASARAILNKPEFREVDVVVGPFFTDQFQYVSDVLAPKGVPVICPIPKPSRILFKRKNAIKMVPSETMQLQSLAEFLAVNYKDSNVIVVNTKRKEDEENIAFFKTRFAKAKNIPDTAIDEQLKQITLWDINYETLTMRMRDSGSYVFVVPSKSSVFVNQFISQLYNVKFRNKEKYHITVIGIEDWLKMEDNLDINHLQALNVTLVLSNYLDHNNYRIKKFFGDYYKKHGFEPNEYTVQGFDVAAYLINALNYQGKEWFTNPEAYTYQGLLTDYSFKRIMNNSGIEATGVRLYRYKNFKMQEVGRWPSQKIK